MNCNHRISVVTAIRVRPPIPGIEDQYFDSSHPMSNSLRIGNYPSEVLSDIVFGSCSSQDQVFHSSIKVQLDRFVIGEDVSVIVYGAPFTGKSHTLFGPGLLFTDSEANYGILPKAASYIFGKLETMYFTNNNRVRNYKMSISVLEVSDSGLKDLLLTPGKPAPLLTLHSNLKGLVTLKGMTEVQCCCPRDMINCLQMAMSNRQIVNNGHVDSHRSSVIVRLELDQRFLLDGEYKSIISQALFTDLACIERPHPTANWNVYGQPLMINYDLYNLTALTKSSGGVIHDPDLKFLKGNDHYVLLQDCFNGKVDNLVICCISPSVHHVELSYKYLSVLMEINKCRLPKLVLYKPPAYFSVSSDENGTRQSQQSSLILRAESMFSRLSVSKSVSEEDKEEFAKWLQLKQECEEESLNAQSHGQLECIEEVTESEEELSSSNEKMSESHPSMENSLYESDQDESDVKVCQLSDSDFFENLDNMCVQFNSFVDTFVDSFKTKSVLTPVKKRKRACSAVRRGGMPYIPKMTPLDDPLPDLLYTQPNEDRLMPLERFQNIKQSASVDELGQLKKSKSADETKQKAVNPQRHKDEQKVKLDNESGDAVVKWILCKEVSMDEQDLGLWLSNEERRLRDLREKWLRWSRKVKTLEDPDVLEQFKILRAEKNKDMYQAAKGMSYFMDLIEEMLLDPDMAETPDEYYLSFNHRIRQLRSAREKFTRMRKSLDARVKDKTSTDWELRNHIMADEMIEALDVTNEYINNMIQRQSSPLPTLAASEVGKLTIEELRDFSIKEIRNLLFWYFKKVVDLRENGKAMEETIAELDLKLAMSSEKIACLNVALQQMRAQSRTQMVVRYPPPEATLPSPTTTLALPQGSGSHARRTGTTIPQQNLSKLQAKPVPATKVTRQPGKLIIEQDRKKH